MPRILLTLLVAAGAMAWALHTDRSLNDIKEAVALFSVGLFVCCMFFHGELAEMKPESLVLVDTDENALYLQ